MSDQGVGSKESGERVADLKGYLEMCPAKVVLSLSDLEMLEGGLSEHDSVGKLLKKYKEGYERGVGFYDVSKGGDTLSLYYISDNGGFVSKVIELNKIASFGGKTIYDSGVDIDAEFKKSNLRVSDRQVCGGTRENPALPAIVDLLKQRKQEILRGMMS